MTTYNITNQSDLETYPINATASDTCIMQNDIALDSTYSPVGLFSGTFDGNGYKISGLTCRPSAKYMTASNSASGVAMTSSINLGETHTISFRMLDTTTASNAAFFPIGNSSNGIYFFRVGSTQYISYYADSFGVQWQTTHSSSFYWTIVRNGLNVSLYRSGNLIGTQTMPASGKSFVLSSGFLNNSSGTWSAGIREILMTSDAKDATFISWNYNNGIARYNPTTIPNLVALWHTSEGSGTTSVESVSGNNLSGVDGWGTENLQTALIYQSSGTIKNLTIDTPNLTNTMPGSARIGGIVGYMPSGTIENCWVKDITISAVYADQNALGGIVGGFNGGNIRNCYVTVASIPKTMQGTTGQIGWSGGIAGYSFGGFVSNCYVYGTNSTTKPDCGLIGYVSYALGGGSVVNCWSSIPVDRHVVQWAAGSYSTITNFYYRNISSVTLDNKSSTGTIVANDSDFYNITQAPMTAWNFGIGGSWSSRLNGSAFPPLKMRITGNVSGSLSGIGSSKTIKISIAQGSPSSTTTSSDNFTFTGLSWMEDQPFVVWLSGDTVKSSLVSALPATSVTGLTMVQNRISLGDVNAYSTLRSPVDIGAACYTGDIDSGYTYVGYLDYRNFVKIPTGCTVVNTAVFQIRLGLENRGTFTDSNGFQLSNTQPNYSLQGDLTFTEMYSNSYPVVITFEHGKTYNYTGSYASSLTDVTFQSDLAGSHFTFNTSGPVTFSGVSVKDCYTDNFDLTAANNSTNLGGTDYKLPSPHWVFPKYITAFKTILNTVSPPA